MTQHKYYFILLFLLAVVIHIITWLLIVSYAPTSGQLVPIHYNVISGYDELGSRADLLQVPVFGMLVVVVNAVIAWLFRSTGRFVGSLAVGVALAVSLVLLLSTLLLVVQA